MTSTAAQTIDSYLDALRRELVARAVADPDGDVAEIRSMLVDAAGDDSQRARAEVDRLGDPAHLARSIAGEAEVGEMSSAVWWRLAVAAPLDFLIGLAVPLAVVVALFSMLWLTRFGVLGALGFVATATAAVWLSVAWPCSCSRLNSSWSSSWPGRS